MQNQHFCKCSFQRTSTSLESTLTRNREGVLLSGPQSFATRYYAHLVVLRAHEHPQPQCSLLLTSRFSGHPGWGGARGGPFPAVSRPSHGSWVTHGPRLLWSSGTVAPQPAKCQNHRCYCLAAPRETSPLLPVSNTESGHRARHPQNAKPGRKSIPERIRGSDKQEGLGPTF